MELKPIGIIHSPYQEATGTPIQPKVSRGEGWIELFEPFVEGLRDLEGFERIWLLFWCHRTSAHSLVVTPYLDTLPHGVFATRSPARPNPLGLSSVRLLSVEGNVLHVQELDMLDNTPLLDIKPYLSRFDCYPDQRAGWMDRCEVTGRRAVADDRFEEK